VQMLRMQIKLAVKLKWNATISQQIAKSWAICEKSRWSQA
jgi:hypothetical protein